VAHHSADGGHQIVDALVAVVGPGEAEANVAVDERECDAVERSLDGLQLCQHVNAAAVVAHHLRDAAHLALDPS